jgi:hypothetical protein
MKVSFKSLAGIMVAGLTVILFAGSSRAEDIVVSDFPDASGISRWRFDYGGVTRLIEFDPAQDANGNPGSGAMKVTFGFDTAIPGGNNKGAVTIDLPTPLDGSGYLTMEMDLKIETGSAADGAGNSGYFQMVIRNTDNYQFNSQFGSNVSTNDGWRHIRVTPTGGRDRIRAITLELYGGSALTGPVVFYVDNVKFTQPATAHDVIVSQFNNAITGWRFDYGGVTNLLRFDTQDATNNPASGSLKTTFGFSVALDATGNNKGAITYDLPAPLNGTLYVSMEMDFKVEGGSAEDFSGNNGYLKMVIRNTPGYSFDVQFEGNVNTNGGWRHIRVSPLTGVFSDIRAITLELYGGSQIDGPVTFYVDNVKFTETNAPPAGPTMSVIKPILGLNLTPASGQYERQSIATIGSQYVWVGRPDPTTYSLTLSSYPDASHSGFQTHIFLVADDPHTDSAPDYTQPNVIFLDIQGQGNGSAFAAFRYKTNEPAGNNFLYRAAPNGGTLGGVSSPTPVGRWSLTFSQDTNVTLTAPGGGVGNFILPPEAAALFANGVTVYIGAQANSGGNLGQTVVVSKFEALSGNQLLLDDDFPSYLSLSAGATSWQVAAGTPGGVQLAGQGAQLWLRWTIPDSGYFLQWTDNLADSGSWAAFGATPPLIGSTKRILLYKHSDFPLFDNSYLPDSNLVFFRLIKP